MKLADCLALSDLEYFELNEKGKLVLAGGVADKIIDFHTHVGMNYLFAPPVDLDRFDDEIETFFPLRGNPVDLEVYSAQSFTKENARIAEKETVKQGLLNGGFARTHTARNLIDEMDRMNVVNSVILAIDFPLGPFSRSSELHLEAARKYPRLIPFISVHPYAPGMEKRARLLKEMGGVGMKLHPAMGLFRANNKRAVKVAELCGKLNLPVLCHTGGSDIAPQWQQDLPHVKYFWGPVEAMPETTFIFGHAGIHYYREAIELAREFDNVHLELSGQPPSRIREMLEAGIEDKLLFGSDFPYYVLALPLAKVLLATKGAPEARRKLLYGNAARLLDKFGIHHD